MPRSQRHLCPSFEYKQMDPFVAAGDNDAP